MAASGKLYYRTAGGAWAAVAVGGGGGGSGASFNTNFFCTASGNQKIPKSTWTKVLFDTATTDDNSEWDAANTRWVCGENGSYLVCAVGTYVADAAGMRGFAAYVDGVIHSYAFGYAWNNGSTITTRAQFSQPIILTAGQYLEIYTYHNSTTNPLQLNAIGSSWSIHRIH